jgi:hypothetical protein
MLTKLSFILLLTETPRNLRQPAELAQRELACAPGVALDICLEPIAAPLPAAYWKVSRQRGCLAGSEEIARSRVELRSLLRLACGSRGPQARA